jgi:hypothetical protein
MAMDRLLHLQDKILRTGAALGRLESEVAVRPDSRTLQSNVLSLRKLHRNLQHDFSVAADNLGLDVCHYQMLEDRPAAKALSGAIGAFQDALSLAYEALRTGPKTRRRVSLTAQQDTELRVAYSYAGSFGVVFTVSNEKLLLPEMQSYLDRAAETVLSVGKAADNAAIVSKTVREIGRAPIIAIHDWAETSARYQAGAAIEWRRADAVRNEVFIQAQEFGALQTSLEKMSEKTDSDLAVSGILVGADTKSRRFHFVVDGTDHDIRGKFFDAISDSHQAEIPMRYVAHLHKTTQVSFATEDEDVSYFLERLEKPRAV